MATATKSKKRGPQPLIRDKVLVSLKEKKRATSGDLGVSTAYMTALENKQFVRRVGKVPHEGRGRPANLYGLTQRGRGRASRVSK